MFNGCLQYGFGVAFFFGLLLQPGQDLLRNACSPNGWLNIHSLYLNRIRPVERFETTAPDRLILVQRNNNTGRFQRFIMNIVLALLRAVPVLQIGV